MCRLVDFPILLSYPEGVKVTVSGISSVMDDQTLIECIKYRDQDAMVALYQRYANLVFSVAYRVLNDETVTEECTQDAFMKVWQNIGQFNPARGSFIAWLVGIARHAAVDRLRQFRHKRAVPTPEAQEDGEHSPGFLADWRDRADSLRLAMRNLPVEQLQALELSYFGGMSQTDIAEYLNIPLGTIKTRMRLGMQKLREAWLCEEPA
jgi:RNA polymerase sigma-70 factor (ECF subfamily)